MKSLSRPNRREFLKQAAVGCAAPLILRSGLLAADTSPSNQLTLGFIGMGTQGRGLLNGFLGHSGTRVLAVCDVDTTRRASAQKTVISHYTKAGAAAADCAAYADFRELVARKDLDGVVIATPDHWHALASIAAAEAGKDIYCEKPMSHTVLEGRAMVNAVRRHQRVFQVGSMQRSSHEFRAACELVRNGCLGKVSKVDVLVGPAPIPCDLPGEPEEPGLNWDTWLGPAPMRPYNSILSPRGVHKHFPLWRNYSEYGGGGVCDWGAHHLDIAHWGLGFDDSGPFEIVPPAKSEDVHGAVLRYAGGVEITHRDGNGVWFYGDKGKIFVNRGKFQLWIGQEQKAEDPGYCAQMLKELLPANAIRLYNSADHLGDWLNSMRTRKPPICNVEIGARTATACNLLNLVYFHRKTLKWDPKAEQLVDHTGDPSWLGRDYRAPWKVA